MSKNAIWLTWENQRRNRELSAALQIPLFEFAEIDTIKNYLKKYFFGIAKTLYVIKEEKPRLVFCQNPSLVLSLFLIILKIFCDIRVVVDSHYAGLFPLKRRYKILNLTSIFIQRYADLTIVTNRILKQHVEMNGGRAFVLQDKIPDLKPTTIKDLKGKYNILFICTYADDEPYEIVFAAAKKINKDIVIYVTGNFDKKGINPTEAPENMILTGFIPEKEYVAMLNSVDATIDLTDRENCLVCGAYESTAAGKPMVLSKTQALMEYFNQGAVYVEHTSDSIASGIAEVIKRNKEISENVQSLKRIRIADWKKRRNELMEIFK